MSEKSQKLPVVQNAKVRQVDINLSYNSEYLIAIRFVVEYYKNNELVSQNIFENIDIPDQDFKTVIYRLLHVFKAEKLSAITEQYARIYLDEFDQVVCIEHIFEEDSRRYNIRAMFPDRFDSEHINVVY